jgi:WD40 repeat protein
MPSTVEEELEALLRGTDKSLINNADFRIIAGTYERLLYGLNVLLPKDTTSSTSTPTSSTSKDSTLQITPVFIYPAHITSIKCLATSHRFLATGSTDEHVKLYDIQLRKEIGSLMHHSGSITALSFFRKSHLITASEDSTIAIVRSKDWEPLKVLKGHEGAIMDVALHPTGKILISVAADSFMRVWDMAKGNCAYTLRLKAVGVKCGWSVESGELYAVMMDRELEIYETESGEVVGTVKSLSRLNAMKFTKVLVKGADGEGKEGKVLDVVVTGCEDGTMAVWDCKGVCWAKWKSGHGSRVKDLDAAVLKDGRSVVVSCSSDGGIKIWDLEKTIEQVRSAKPPVESTSTTTVESDGQPPSKKAIPFVPTATPIGSYEAKCRLTCITIASSLSEKKAKSTGNATQVKSGVQSATSDAADDDESENESEVEGLLGSGPKVSVSYDDNDNVDGQQSDDDDSNNKKNTNKKATPSTKPKASGGKKPILKKGTQVHKKKVGGQVGSGGGGVKAGGVAKKAKKGNAGFEVKPKKK